MTALDDYFAAVLRATDRLANAARTEDPEVIERELARARATERPDSAPDVDTALLLAAVVQIDTDIPWRERFAWTFDIHTVAGRPADPGPSSGSYVSQSAALDPVTWGAAPSSSTKAAA